MGIDTDLSRLTQQEQMHVLRRREHLTQNEFAAKHGMKGHTMARMEQGKLPMAAHVVSDDDVAAEPWELARVARRRLGWGIKEAAKKMKISHVTLTYWEKGWRNWPQYVARLEAVGFRFPSRQDGGGAQREAEEQLA